MSLFSAILDKLGFEKQAEAVTPQSSATATPDASAHPDAVAPQAPTAIGQIDVVAKLEDMAAANPQKLNWKVSIVDLLKLISLHTSPVATA